MRVPDPKNRHWLNGWGGAALLLSVGGCNRFWEAPPPRPTADQVAELRMATEAAGPIPPQPDTRPEGVTAAEGPAAQKPPPLRSFHEWSVSETAADSLVRIGAAAVPPLIRELASPDPEVRWQVTMLLGRIGPDAALAVPELVRLLDDDDPRVGLAAARTLGQIGPAAAAAVPALIEQLDDPRRP